ncbi:XRE family transcriptional regulator [Nonomuraea longicatena]|uniref:XRE family transcriptional regulator n=2 Tax=Nonomuraea longicatena TaxID=83682 RepID=A0ABP3ZJG6_9ACTN
MINATIASNVRAHRAHRGLTLDALAARSGVSRGMLVQVEQGRTNPSVSTLTRIASALGVTVARLVEVSDVPVVRVIPPEQAVSFEMGESRARLLIGADVPMILELWEWTLAPGEHHNGDAHPAGTREMLTVLSGELTLTVYGGDHVVQTGSAALFTADRPHRYANRGTGETRFIMVVSEPREADDR